MRRRVLALLLALVLAVAGAVLVLAYIARADERALAGQDPESVWIAAKAVPAGTPLKAAEKRGLLERTRVPARSVPRGALTDIDADNEDLVALGDVPPGEVVLAARFGDTPTGDKAIEVPRGKLAVSVQLSDPARVGSFTRPGSHLVIYHQRKLIDLSGTERAKLINEQEFADTSVLISDVLVIGVGDTPLSAPQTSPAPDPESPDAAATGSQSEGTKFLVTVAVTPRQAIRLVHEATRNGLLYAGLRSSTVKVGPREQIDDLHWPGGIR